MFKIDIRDIKEFEADLKTFRRRAYPFATRETVHQAAVTARFKAVEIVRNQMTLRNKFTVQSIQFAPSKSNQITLRVSRQEAFTGSTADFMEDQEFGTTKVSRGEEGVPIATTFASGEGRGARPRRRLPRRPNVMKNIQLNKRRRVAKNRKQLNVFRVQDAVTSGRRYVFLDFGRKRGIFRVVGGSKRFKRGWPKGAKVEAVWDMTDRSVVIPPNPWLGPAVEQTRQEIPAIYHKALIFQLKRNNLFRG